MTHVLIDNSCLIALHVWIDGFIWLIPLHILIDYIIWPIVVHVLIDDTSCLNLTTHFNVLFLNYQTIHKFCNFFFWKWNTLSDVFIECWNLPACISIFYFIAFFKWLVIFYVNNCNNWSLFLVPVETKAILKYFLLTSVTCRPYRRFFHSKWLYALCYVHYCNKHSINIKHVIILS